MPPSFFSCRKVETYEMPDDERERARVLATHWEVLLAKLLLRIADKITGDDPDQEFLELYNDLKPLAEHTLRGGHRGRTGMKGVKNG